MKKILTIFLAIIFVCALSFALADDYETSNVNISFNEQYEKINVTAQIKNTSDRTMVLSYKSIMALVDGETEVYKVDSMTLIPSQLEPGEEGYLVSNVYLRELEDKESVKKANDIKLDLYFEPPYETKYIYKAELVHEEAVYYGEKIPVVTAVVENDSDEPTNDMSVTIVWKDKEGKSLILDDQHFYVGLYPGSKARYVKVLDEYMLNNLKEYNFDIDIEKTEVIAYSKYEY